MIYIMSLKSFFRKKHKYETQSDLKDMTAEQIVNLNPQDVGSYIETETGGIPLTGIKRKAMFRLLAIKKQDKLNPNPVARQDAINTFLEREGLKSNPEVDRLIMSTHNEIMEDQVSQKQLENRLRKLRDQSAIPYTKDEESYLRLQKLKIGGKRKRYTKRKLREKTKRKIRRNKRKTYRK
jgi:hypothetical protein